ncbi:hypothetical protein GOP47_0020177 [Adiantum capillus-veneris]|uniref:FLZ-type domain-containing protein n=1 Tax=Adiantum capillus-veneris TaxID=13818 RepID=A0A9D4Z9A9_ADICA|nr:hypothetical protein GOP47_0020177 [Adiantum capillus-veneris]
MLGKRPHQIQRTTSMTQLRVPPGARARTPAPRDFMMPQRLRKPVDSNHHVHSKAAHPIPEALHGRFEVESAATHITAATCMHTNIAPADHHLKASSASPLPLSSSTTYSWMPSTPLFTKLRNTVSESFMDACFSCKNPLGHGRDIFMYRGDAAFCSEDCRLRQITYDECQQRCAISSCQGTRAGDDDVVRTSESAKSTPSTGEL